MYRSVLTNTSAVVSHGIQSHVIKNHVIWPPSFFIRRNARVLRPFTTTKWPLCPIMRSIHSKPLPKPVERGIRTYLDDHQPNWPISLTNRHPRLPLRASSYSYQLHPTAYVHTLDRESGMVDLNLEKYSGSMQKRRQVNKTGSCISTTVADSRSSAQSFRPISLAVKMYSINPAFVSKIF